MWLCRSREEANWIFSSELSCFGDMMQCLGCENPEKIGYCFHKTFCFIAFSMIRWLFFDQNFSLFFSNFTALFFALWKGLVLFLHFRDRLFTCPTCAFVYTRSKAVLKGLKGNLSTNHNWVIILADEYLTALTWKFSRAAKGFPHTPFSLRKLWSSRVRCGGSRIS